MSTPFSDRAFMGDPECNVPPELNSWRDAYSMCQTMERRIMTLEKALSDAEKEARNEIARLRILGQTDGPEFELWTKNQQIWSSALSRQGQLLGGQNET